MQLLELAREDGDHYLCGQAEDLLADIIAATYGGHEVVEHRLNAADHYLQADSVRAHRYAMLDVAIAHANNDSLRLGMFLLDSIRSIAGSDSALTANCLRASMRITARLDGLREFDSRKLKQYRRFFTPTAADYAYLAISKSTMKAKAERYRHAMPEIAAEIETEPADYGLYLDSARAIARTESEYKLIDWATAECYRNAGEPELWKSYTDSLCEQRLYGRQPTASETVVGAQRDFQSDRATTLAGFKPADNTHLCHTALYRHCGRGLCLLPPAHESEKCRNRSADGIARQSEQRDSTRTCIVIRPYHAHRKPLP